ncbi:MAG: Hsp20/alpha crystallin family protein [Promethearchaeota archaeon]
MSIIESKTNQHEELETKKTKEVENKTKDESEIYYHVYPDMHRVIDKENNLIRFEVSLPGVSKKDIILKVLSNWFHLTGNRGHLEYCANQSFGIDIIPEKTTAKYSNGLLTIEAHIKDPMDDAIKISLE